MMSVLRSVCGFHSFYFGMKELFFVLSRGHVAVACLPAAAWIVGEGVGQESLCPSSGLEKKKGSVCSMYYPMSAVMAVHLLTDMSRYVTVQNISFCLRGY